MACFCAAALWTTSAHALEPQSWDYSGGGNWALARAPSAQAVANPTLDRAERMLIAGQKEPALKLVLRWIKSHPKAPDRDRGLYLLAEAYFQDDDRIRAYYHLDELLDTYPESRLFYPALEKQYRIADEFLRGYKRKLLGMRILSGTDEAIDMLYRIQERAPGSPLAERALLRTADYYFNTSQFDLAADAYAAFVRSYARSPEVPRVRARQAFASYAQFRGVRFDATPLIDARAQLQDLRVRYPQLAADLEVQKFIDQINDTLARKLLYTADFYRRTHKPRAALYTYRQLISTYPETREAQLAAREMQSLPAWSLQEPLHATSRPAEPPTLPPAGSPGTRPVLIPAPQVGP
jgi:outer membrane assembly lipoprotein YfiO